MGWTFGWNAINDLMDRAVEADQDRAIISTLAATPSVIRVHELRTRRMGDLIAADASGGRGHPQRQAGHDVAVRRRCRVIQAHPVLSLMIHVDPWRRLTAITTPAPVRAVRVLGDPGSDPVPDQHHLCQP